MYEDPIVHAATRAEIGEPDSAVTDLETVTRGVVWADIATTPERLLLHGYPCFERLAAQIPPRGVR